MSEAETPAAAPAEGEAAAAEVEETAVETPAEGAAPVEGEQAEAVEVEGEEKPPEETKPEDEKAAITEEALRVAAVRFANKTMAAARRAEREVETVRGANEKLTGEIATYRGFVDQFQSDPMAALRRLPGFTSLKSFVERCVASGAPVAPKLDDEVADLKKWRADREAADRNREAEVQNQASQGRVFSALEKEPDRFDLVMTDDGRTKLWNSIVAYRAAHGRVPNEKVFEMAEAIEERMTASLAKSKKFAQAQSAKTGDSAAANARPAASKTGAKTITNRSSSSGIVVRDYSKMTEKERDAAILADMYASGELTRAP